MFVTVAFAFAGSGCGDSKKAPPPGSFDAGTDASRDSGNRDGASADRNISDAFGIDGAEEDASTFADASTDSSITSDSGPNPQDAGSSDTGTSDSGPHDSGPFVDSGIHACDFLPPGTPCGVGDTCAAGFQCINDGCGGKRCLPAGNPCTDNTDCHASSSCMNFTSFKACVRSGGGCNDSRDCPVGFACESGSCHDRRTGCAALNVCPYGYTCVDIDLGSAPFCARLLKRCATNGACLANSKCIDVDGDGLKECFYPSGSGGCSNNATCASTSQTPVCEVKPEFNIGACGKYGPCRNNSDCPSTFNCVDLWGDGIKECIAPGSSCTRTQDCSGQSICATPAGGDPLYPGPAGEPGPTQCQSRPF